MRGGDGRDRGHKLDRFARTVLGAVGTLEELGRHQATFASATEPQLDYTTPAGRAFVQQLFVFAEFTRSTLKESWATSQRYAIERGIHISPNGFFGYDLGSDRRLIPNGHAPLVREAYARRGAGESWGSLAEWLNEVAPKDDGTQWTGLVVARMVEKRVYRGEASRYVTQDKDARGPVVNPDAHPALVTEAEWQAQANPRIARGTHRDGTAYPLLSGLVRCAGCRYVMSQGWAHRQRVYTCRRKHASGTCPRPAMISADRFDAYIDAVVAGQLDGRAHQVADSAERTRSSRNWRRRATTDTPRVTRAQQIYRRQAFPASPPTRAKAAAGGELPRGRQCRSHARAPQRSASAWPLHGSA
ncbi:MAG: recombinase family protein [Solirubrobacteraceae bacterium]